MIRLFLLLALWCAPAWADNSLNDCRTGKLPIGQCADIFSKHNCSLLTVAHNGTVFVVQGLTKQKADSLSMNLYPRAANGGMLTPVSMVKYAEVFCD